MQSQFLQGAHAPVDEEVDFDVAVEGELPEGLRGSYLRNGPNPAFEPKEQYHLFDGDGMLHALDFEDGRVRYRNRWIRTAGLELERELGHALYGGLSSANPPTDEEVGGGSRIKNPANTNIIQHAGRVLALWEGGLPTSVTRDLETLGSEDFSGGLVGSMTAHPKIDPVNGELCFFGYSPFPPYLRYHEVNAQGKLVHSTEIEIPHPVMMHDFIVTRDHVVFFDSPAVFDIESYASGGPMIDWKPELGTRLGVMPRRGNGADIRWFDIPTTYVFHFMNAWSSGNQIQIFGAGAEWITLDLENSNPPPDVDTSNYLDEWVIDLDAGTVSTRHFIERAGDFCKVPDAVAGIEHRYGYLSSFSSGIFDGGHFDSLTMVDLKEQTHVSWEQPGRIVGEAAFAPDLQDSSGDENAGWVVAYVNDADGRNSEFVAIDARDFAAGPVARIKMPRRVPFGFHGNWLPQRA